MSLRWRCVSCIQQKAGSCFPIYFLSLCLFIGVLRSLILSANNGQWLLIPVYFFSVSGCVSPFLRFCWCEFICCFSFLLVKWAFFVHVFLLILSVRLDICACICGLLLSVAHLTWAFLISLFPLRSQVYFW